MFDKIVERLDVISMYWHRVCHKVAQSPAAPVVEPVAPDAGSCKTGKFVVFYYLHLPTATDVMAIISLVLLEGCSTTYSAYLLLAAANAIVHHKI